MEADGTVTTSQQGVALSDEKEKISSVLNTGKYESSIYASLPFCDLLSPDMLTKYLDE